MLQPSVTCTDNGTYQLTLKVTDDDDLDATDTAALTVENVAPAATFNAPASVNEASAMALSLTNPDDASSVDEAAGFQYAFDCGNGAGYGAFSGTSTASCSTDDNGTRTVKGKVKDKDGGEGEYTKSVTIVNVPPTATFNAPASVNEGSAIALSLTNADDVSSVDKAAGFEYAFDCGTGYGAYSGTSTASCATNDNGTRAVKGKIKDKDDGETEYTASVTIQNVAPTLGPITIAPYDVLQVGTTVNLSSPFSDVGTADTHTGVIDWDDGSTSNATVAESNGSGTAIGSHTYTTPNVYTVKLTVTDDDGGSSYAIYEYVVVYDPSAGFVTGGGWINSPAGAYQPDPSLFGKANFGFVSKYQKGATTPTGNTEFQFHAGSLNFSSTSYEWLVVQGNSSKATYKGVGTVNGAAGYGFLLSAIDNGSSGDRFRIKIWNRATGNIVYDNQLTGTTGDDADPTTQIAAGSIVIHTGRK